MSLSLHLSPDDFTLSLTNNINYVVLYLSLAIYFPVYSSFEIFAYYTSLLNKIYICIYFKRVKVYLNLFIQSDFIIRLRITNIDIVL